VKYFRAVLSRAGVSESFKKDSAGSGMDVLCTGLIFAHKSNKEKVAKGSYGEFESVFFAWIDFIIKIELTIVGTIHSLYC